MDETFKSVAYLQPEVTEVIDSLSGERVEICRVAVMEDKVLRGYIPLPMRYEAVWLELSYNIVVYTNIWRLWAEEEEHARRQSQKQKAGMLRRTTGTLVAQHMLARLHAVLELVGWHDTEPSGQERVITLDEWKIRSCRDWFNLSYEQVPSKDLKFLNADPIKPENRVFFGEFVSRGRVPTLFNYRNIEGDWTIADEGKGLLSPPEDTAEWIDGEIDGLAEIFRDTLKPQALAALKSEDYYFQTQYDQKAKLPKRWHEGHQPRPYFWSVKHWSWVARGDVVDI
jgi:hypothetical protein